MDTAARKRRIAFWSPLPPQRSGVADYSVELLEQLTELCEVEIFVDDSYVPAIELYTRFVIYPDSTYELRHKQAPFDINVYHMGNNLFHRRMLAQAFAHPSLVVLRDVSLFDLYHHLWLSTGQQREFLDEVEYACSSADRIRAKAMVNGTHPVDRLALMMTRRLIETSLGTIAHKCITTLSCLTAPWRRWGS